MRYCMVNNSDVPLLVDFTDGSERILHINQYILYNGPAEITEGAKRDLVDVGLLNVWHVDSIEITHDMTKVIDKEQGQVKWMVEGF